jgi:hypothetical protein
VKNKTRLVMKMQSVHARVAKTKRPHTLMELRGVNDTSRQRWSAIDRKYVLTMSHTRKSFAVRESVKAQPLGGANPNAAPKTA